MDFLEDKNPANNFGRTPFHEATRATCSSKCVCQLMKENVDSRDVTIDRDGVHLVYVSGDLAYKNFMETVFSKLR